jgi:putative addiction module CopG family antidote
MDITLEPALEKFVRSKVESGDFHSPDDVVSQGLPLLQQQEENWISNARSAIEEGWSQAKSGQLRSADQARQNMTMRKRAWISRRPEE